MTLITIDKDTCTKCCLCVTQCNIIIGKEGMVPRQMPNSDAFCMRCGHCLAICPTGAIKHKEMTDTPTYRKVVGDFLRAMYSAY